MMDRRTLLELVERDELPKSQLYDCPYLAGKQARQTGFLAERMDGELYHDLMDRGVRRNGSVFYAMACPDCAKCLPLRVPVAEFRPSRSQRRTLNRNRDVRVEFREPEFTTATHELYIRYLRHQHPGSPADESVDQFRTSLYERCVDTLEARYLAGDKLIGISILDRCTRSLSAVYHFFEPDERQRRVGVLSALLEIEHARQRKIPHYYLGYWIEDAPTMSYKTEYRPNELLLDGVWKRNTDSL